MPGTGYAVRSYHLVNVAVHALCAVMVWAILLSLERSRCTALLGALLFAAHPVCTEPVNYISSRSELLATLGVLASFWFYARSHEEPSRGYRLLSVLAFAGGLLSKSVAICLPVLLLSLDAFRGNLSWRGSSVRRHLPYLATSFVYLGMVWGFAHKALLGQPVRALSAQFATQLKALVYYAKILFMPIDLSVHHAFSEGRFDEQTVLVSLLPILSVVLLIATHFKGALTWSRSKLFVGVVWVFASLSPTLIIPLNVLVNEHRLHFPLVGCVILLTAIRGLENIRGILWGTPLLLALFGILTIQRNTDWETEYSLWAGASEVSPNESRPYVYMGNYLREHGRVREAVRMFETALQLDDGDLTARNNLGNAYRQMEEWDKAIQIYIEIFDEQPNLSDVRYNLGVSYQGAGKIALARASYRAVDDASFHSDLALNNLGTLYEREGRLDSALHYYEAAVRRRTSSPDAASNIERLDREFHQHAGRLHRAGEIEQLNSFSRAVLARNPGHRDARFFLAVSFFEAGRYSASIAECQRLVQQYPDFGHGRLQLANGLEASGRFDEARKHYEELVRSNNDSRIS